MRRRSWTATAAVPAGAVLTCLALAACGPGPVPMGAATGTPAPTGGAATTGTGAEAAGTASGTTAGTGAVRTPTPVGGAGTATGPGALRGRVVVIDPGHDGGNGTHAAQINRLVDIGNGVKACDTAGTETNAGYAESAFTFDVSTRLAALLRAAGATVVLTRRDDRGVGPCISERASIGNRAHAAAALSIHGDGAPAAGYGFHVIVPKSIGRNEAIVAPSRQLGVRVRDAFRAGTGEALSTYIGGSGALVARDDLGGLNLSTVPKVFIECGNMRNAADAARMTSPAWRQRAAVALAAGITRFLTADAPG